MKFTKISFIIAAAALVVLGLGTSSFAFHSGGVAECEGCHTMHNSLHDEAMTTLDGLTQFNAGPYLLQGNNASEACLNCHQHEGDTVPTSYHISTAAADMVANAPIQRTPGGDFGWIRKDYFFTVRGGANSNYGAARGHSISAPAYGYDTAAAGTVSPGGAYPADQFGCASCHDPHSAYRRTDDAGTMVKPTIGSAGLPIVRSGSYHSSAAPTAWGAVGVYRILGGIGYLPKSLGTGAGALAFNANPPHAVAPSTYNRTEAVSQTRVAYGAGMSEWCANCHGQMHQTGYQSGVSGQVHPAGNGSTLGAAIMANYNAYVKSGDLSGTSATAYSSLVPFEEGGTVDYATLRANATPTVLTGADANSQVMCLSCHRAHASGFESMLRFAHANEFMTEADTAGNPIYPANPASGPAQGMTQAEIAAAYYDRPATVFAPYQRLLCNKCHAKD
jgi:hypothetical protein